MNADVNRVALCVTIPGKLLLSGEHIVFNGAAAVGVPAHECLTARFTPRSRGGFACESYCVAPDETRCGVEVPAAFLNFANAVCEHHNLPQCGKTVRGVLQIQSTIPLASGLGSSAALCCAFARIVLHHTQKRSTASDVWRLAHRFEQFFHARASGVDTALCAYGMPLVLISHKQRMGVQTPFAVSRVPLRTVRTLHLVYGVVPRSISTSCAKNIRAVQKKLRDDALRQRFITTANNAARTLGRVAGAQVEKNRRRAIGFFVKHLNQTQEHLCALALSTPRVEKTLQRALDYGALAAKISGGGGGGAFVCICASAHDAAECATALQTMHNAPLFARVY